MRELVSLKVDDPSVTGSIASGVIEMSAVFVAPSPKEATDAADVAFRSALHAAGVFTDGWGEPGPVRIAWHRIEADDSDDDCVPV